MQWLNLHVSALDSPAFLGADPTCRATWLCLMRYAIGQEAGGVILGAKTWGDRKWQQLCRVTLAEVLECCELWTWEGDNLLIQFYPLDKQAEVQRLRALGSSKSEAKRAAARVNGLSGGRPITQHKNPKQTQRLTEQETHGEPIEGNRKERKGRERASARDGQPTPPPAGGSLPSQEQLDEIRERDPTRYATAVAGLTDAEVLEVLTVAGPEAYWPSHLEAARIDWEEPKKVEAYQDKEDEKKAAESKREAAVAAAVPAMLERARRMLAFLDAHPEITERMEIRETQRVGLLRAATAEGKPNIAAEFLAMAVPELRQFKLQSSAGNEKANL